MEREEIAVWQAETEKKKRTCTARQLSVSLIFVMENEAEVEGPCFVEKRRKTWESSREDNIHSLAISRGLYRSGVVAVAMISSSSSSLKTFLRLFSVQYHVLSISHAFFHLILLPGKIGTKIV